MPKSDATVKLFNLGGYKLSALEIERILLEHENIKECAVVGVPDEKWGEVRVISERNFRNKIFASVQVRP